MEAALIVARYRFGVDGSLSIQWLGLDGNPSACLRIGPGRRVSLLGASGAEWREIELRAGPSPRGGRLLVTLHTARREEDAIAVTYLARNDHGRAIEASGAFRGRENDSWRWVDERRSGLRITTEGDRNRVLSTAVDADGRVRWQRERVAEPTPVRSGSGNAPFKVDTYRDADDRVIGRGGTWEGPNGRGSYSEATIGSMHYDETHWYGNDGTDSMTQRWSDGTSSSTTQREWTQEGGLRHEHKVETNSGPGGTSSKTTDDWIGTEKNPITGEENQVHYHEETTTDTAGNTTTDRVAAVTDSAGNGSSTHSVVKTDGSVEITTRTVDGNGNGTEHVTVVDRNGTVKKDEIHDVKGGEAQPSPPPSPGDGDGGEAGPSPAPSPGDDDGGDDGMDWEGADDIRPKLPRLTNALAVELGPPSEATPAEDEAWAEAFAAAVNALVSSGREPDESLPEIVPSGGGAYAPEGSAKPGGATGEGDWGAEGLPQLRPQAGDWSTMMLRGSRGPTEDWGEWTDPRVLVARALDLTAAVAAEPKADGRGVLNAFNALRGLDAAVRLVRLRT